MKRLLIVLTILDVLTLVGGVLGNAVSLPPSIKEISWPLFGCISIAVVTLGVITQAQLVHAKNALYWALVIVVFGSLLSFTGWAWLTAKPATNYFVLDATEKMMPIFGDVHARVVKVASVAAGNKHGLGLRIYGGKVYGSTTGSSLACDENTEPFIAPNFYANPQSEIDGYLDDVEPSGDGSLLVAMRRTVDQDIAIYDKPITLIIITSGAYSECSPPPPPSYLERTVEKINDVRMNIDLRILIVSIGKLDPQSADLLDGYATSFGGCHVNIPTPDDLPQVIQANSSYCSNYPIVRPTQTSKP